MIACLAIPYFAAAVEQRDDDGLRGRPLVIGGQPWEPRPVYAFSWDVARRGVRPGMPLRLAHLLSPHSCFLPPAPPVYYRASDEIVAILSEFTPQVAPEELWHMPADPHWRPRAGGRSLPARYTVDLAGLPERELLPLAQEMGRTLRQATALAPAVGLAPHPFTAQVAAALARPNHARQVAVADETAFLAGQSIQFLPLDREMARRLALLGIRTMGQLTALPLAELQAQFGPEITPLYRLALGQDETAVSPPPPTLAEQIDYQFDDPLEDMLALAAVLTQTAHLLAQRLQVAGLAARRVSVTWETDDRPGAGGNDWSGGRRGTLRRPTDQAGRLAETLQALLRPVTFATGIVALSVVVDDLTAVRARQLTLFPAAASDPHRSNAGDPAFSLPARYGPGHLYTPVLTDRAHPLPERRFQLRSLPAAGDG